MRSYLAGGVVVWGLIMLVTGCSDSSHYYRVTDPATGKTYYGTKVDAGKEGAVTIKDVKTGTMVTIQSSEVKEISAGEYEAGLHAQSSEQK